MFEPIRIRSYRHDYQVDFVANFMEALCATTRENDWLVVDARIPELYPELADFLKARPHFSIDASEEQKRYGALAPLFEQLVEQRFTRKDRLIAIGGGVTQDIAGFMASLLFRGVDWFFFPTNLLTQCDSCIGSKTSINLGKYKNQLGTFHPPRQIFIDVKFLDTLPAEELRAGLGEILHYLLVTSEEYLALAERSFPDAQTNPEILAELIHLSLSIKAEMIQLDEFDLGPRNVFNYGHSFGHAIESATGYDVPHGAGVGFGMDIANVLSCDGGLVDAEFRNRARRVIANVVVGYDLSGISLSQFLEALSRDKKNEGSQVNVILTRGPGKMFKTPLELSERVKHRLAEYFQSRLWNEDL